MDPVSFNNSDQKQKEKWYMILLAILPFSCCLLPAIITAVGVAGLYYVGGGIIGFIVVGCCGFIIHKARKRNCDDCKL
jgi:hypothetical protein